MAAAPRFHLLLQLGAVAAASSLLVLAASSGPIDAALPPMISRHGSAARTVDDRGVPAAVARRLGTPHGLRRRLSDIPAAAPAAAGGFSDIPAPAPAAADDYDISAEAPDAAVDYDYDYGHDYDYPAGAPEYLPYDYDYDDVLAVAPSVDDHDGGVVVPLWLLVLLCVLSGIGGSIVFYLLIVGLVKCAVSLQSYVAGLYAAAKTARETATRVRPLDQEAVEAAGH